MFYQAEHIGTADYFKIEQQENFNFPPHLHRSFELILVDFGEMVITIDDTPYLLHQGESVLIFPDQIHSLQSTSSRHTLFIFSPQIIQSFFTEKSGKLPVKNTFFLPPYITSALRTLSLQSSKFEMKGALYSVCALFDQQTAYYNVERTPKNLLAKILHYIDQNFTGNCTLITLSDSIGYNPEYISRFFGKKMGMSYNHYVNSRRLNHAAHLLTNTDDTCLRCAMDSGYTSLRSFNRNFKEHFGITPQEYRNQHSAFLK